MRLSSLAICATAFFNVISSEPPNAARSLPTNQYAVSSYNQRSPLHTSVAENKWNRNLHKKIFICANINWCRRRREWDARNLTFFYLGVSASHGRVNKKHVCSNEKWKESESLRHCSISMHETIKKSLLLIARRRERERLSHKRKFAAIESRKASLGIHQAFVSAIPGQSHACFVGGVVCTKCHHSLVEKQLKFGPRSGGRGLMIGFASISKQKQKFRTLCSRFCKLESSANCKRFPPTLLSSHISFFWIVSLPFIENADYFAWRLLNALFVIALRVNKYFDRLQRILIDRYVRFVW